ncbi:MAG: hypothetical protein SWH54_01415 [Thermodesulfobacteriota bacterium]|nr:hypothetical protein [Thermodesulfobacteriota bacterium]
MARILRCGDVEYIHQTTDNEHEIQSISGHYTIEKELRLKYCGNIVLCVIGTGIIDSSCCGMGGCRYALVPGYIVKWKEKANSTGLMVSQVEPVAEENSKKKISKTLKEQELVTQVNFW